MRVTCINPVQEGRSVSSDDETKCYTLQFLENMLNLYWQI